MLDEIKEAQEYMYSPVIPEHQSDRIQLTLFWHAGDLNGLDRMMTTIARYFLFVDNEETDNIFRRAEAALRMWTGNTPLNYIDYRNNKTYGLDKEAELALEYEYLTVNYPWLNWWLPSYIRNGSKDMGEKEKQKAEKVIENLGKRKSQFGRSVFSQSNGTNDYKKLSYEKAIANAYSARGPLKRYYLACTDSQWAQEITRKGGKRLIHDHADRVLKVLAAYMLERSRKTRNDDELRYEPVNYTDIAFWAVSRSKLDGSVLKQYMVSGRPLFDCISASSGNQAKIKPDREWFNSCGWTLIDATYDDKALEEFLSEHPDAVYFRDNGGAVPLSINQRYVKA